MDFLIALWQQIACQFCPVHLAANIKCLVLMLPFGAVMVAWVRSKFKKHEKAETMKHHGCCHPHDEHKEV